ncbi:MAG: restriction endonuclease subunit S [Methanothrix sp.]
MSENNGVPGWKSKILRDLVQVKGGRRLPKGHNFADGPTEYPYLRVTDFKNYSIDLSELKFLTNDDRELIKRYTISSDDVYISIAGTIGLVGTVPHELDGANLTENAAKLIINRDELDKDYLIYYLTSSKGRNEIETRIAKTSQPKLAISRIEQISLTYPSVSEQRAISRVLRAVQQAREARLREIALERERKAALMEHLFRHGTRGEATKETDIGEMPESWTIEKLSDLCCDGHGFIQTGPFGSQLHSSDYKECGIPVVNPTHLGFNTINEGALPFIDKEDADRLSKHYLIEGDILISRRGDFSRYSYITDHQSGWLCGTGCILIRINNPTMNNYFLSVLMGHKVVQNYFDLNSVGSIMPNLNTKILVGLPILLPPLDEQQKISRTLRACDAKIAALEHEAHMHDELFRAMLEELMTGRLRAGALAEKLHD